LGETTQLSRRSAVGLFAAACLSVSCMSSSGEEAQVEGAFAAIERSIGGRLGVAAIDTGTGRRLAYRGTERFAMCSTFKLLLAACILKKADETQGYLATRVSYDEKDLQEYGPVVRAHLHEGALTIAELCAAAVEVSDNAAANLLLRQIDGPAGLTRFIRTLGDPTTRLDRIEPALNSALPGDVRDTTSPVAMVESAAKVLTGQVLSAAGREQLAAWLVASTTGAKRLRAGFPPAWRGGDKTGTGEREALGDVGIFWPPGKPPIIVAAYVMEGSSRRPEREQAIAAVGRFVADSLCKKDPRL
jgi:beta-lactamase class A